jgi:hypothetical protein
MVLAATVLAVSRLKPWMKVGIIIAVSLTVKFRPGIDVDNIMFMISAIAGSILGEALPFRKGMNIFLSIVISLIIFNAYLWAF